MYLLSSSQRYHFKLIDLKGRAPKKNSCPYPFQAALIDGRIAISAARHPRKDDMAGKKYATGNTYKRTLKDGTTVYDAVAYYGRDANGKPIRRWARGFGREADADHELARMKVDPTWRPSDGSSVAELVAAYIEQLAGQGKELTTLNRYRGLLARNIAPFIGKINACGLRGDQLDKFYAKLLREGARPGRPLSGTSVRHVHQLLNSTYSWALRKRLVTFSPTLEADPPSRMKVGGRAAKLTEARSIIMAMKGHRMEAPMLLAMATGMRRGEVAALRADHIDAEAGIIRVCESLANGGVGKVYVKTTKSGRAREVPINDMAKSALHIARVSRAKWKLAAGEAWVDSGYLFTDELGRRLHPNTLTDAFRRLCEPLGMQYRLHDMRHTAATFMLHAGKSINTVQQILGHAAASTTVNIYGHVLEGAKPDAMAALDRMLRGEAR